MPLAAVGEALVLTALLNTTYVSLHTGDPGVSGANEVSGGSYARESATFTQSGSNPTTASNDGVIQFTQATAPWGSVTHFGLWDAVSGGDILAWGTLDSSRNMITGDIARWEIGSLSVTAD